MTAQVSPVGPAGCLWEPLLHIRHHSIELGDRGMLPASPPSSLQGPGQTTASVSLLAVLAEVILQRPLVTSPRLAFPLPWQLQFPRFPLGPQELDASTVSNLWQRIRTPGFRSWIPHRLRMEGHKFSLPPWIIRIISNNHGDE